MRNRTENHTNHSSDRRRAAGFVTLTPRTFALDSRMISQEHKASRVGCVPLEEGNAVAAADVVGDLSSEALVVHQQEIQLPYVTDQELLQATGEEVASLG